MSHVGYARQYTAISSPERPRVVIFVCDRSRYSSRCFLAYRGANSLFPSWNSRQRQTGKLFRTLGRGWQQLRLANSDTISTLKPWLCLELAFAGFTRIEEEPVILLGSQGLAEDVMIVFHHPRGDLGVFGLFEVARNLLK
jgi:hypothetical protein